LPTHRATRVATAGGGTGDPSATAPETPGTDESGFRVKAIIGRAPARSPVIGGPQSLTSTSSWDLAGQHPAHGVTRPSRMCHGGVGAEEQFGAESASPPPHPPGRHSRARGPAPPPARDRPRGTMSAAEVVVVAADVDVRTETVIGRPADMDLRPGFHSVGFHSVGFHSVAPPCVPPPRVELRTYLNWCRNRSGPLAAKRRGTVRS
jgi:hypothetical protein